MSTPDKWLFWTAVVFTATMFVLLLPRLPKPSHVDVVVDEQTGCEYLATRGGTGALVQRVDGHGRHMGCVQ